MNFSTVIKTPGGLFQLYYYFILCAGTVGSLVWIDRASRHWAEFRASPMLAVWMFLEIALTIAGWMMPISRASRKVSINYVYIVSALLTASVFLKAVIGLMSFAI